MGAAENDQSLTAFLRTVHAEDVLTGTVTEVTHSQTTVLLDGYTDKSVGVIGATQPDPFQQFARNVHVGQVLHGPVTKLVPFGAFIRVADGVEGLVHLSELATPPVTASQNAVRLGEKVTVVITQIDCQQRRLTFSRRLAK